MHHALQQPMWGGTTGPGLPYGTESINPHSLGMQPGRCFALGGGVLLGAGGWHCGPTPRAVAADPRDSPKAAAAPRLSRDCRHQRTVPPQHHERKVRGSPPTAGRPQSFAPISIPALGCASHRSRGQCLAPDPILPPQRRFRCWIWHPLQCHGYPRAPQAPILCPPRGVHSSQGRIPVLLSLHAPRRVCSELHAKQNTEL